MNKDVVGVIHVVDAIPMEVVLVLEDITMIFTLPNKVFWLLVDLYLGLNLCCLLCVLQDLLKTDKTDDAERLLTDYRFRW